MGDTEGTLDGLEIRPTRPDDQAALIRFLVDAFRVTPDAPFVQPKLLQWKYFDPRTDWQSPRTYLAIQKTTIVAHAGLYPLTFVNPDGEYRGFHVIDWAASPAARGAGGLLVRKSIELAEVVISIGGSDAARAVLAKMGFALVGGQGVFARVVRPTRLLRSSPSYDWKTPLRFIRNTIWSRVPLAQLDHRWSVLRILCFDQSVLDLGTRAATCKRTAPMMNYMLGCPGVAASGFLIQHAGVPIGYFMLMRVRGQTRIVDLSLDSDEIGDWVAGYACATRVAAEDPATCEVIAASSDERGQRALLRNGFRLRKQQSILLRDPLKRLADTGSLNLALLDNDAAFLDTLDYPFLT